MSSDEIVAPQSGIDEMLQQIRGLEGKCVQIYDMEYTFALTWASRERDRKYVNINGQFARCMGWVDEEQKYAVQTFEGIWAVVPEENLRESELPPVEDGGVDVFWPVDGESYEDFGEAIVQVLSNRGYCVVQMFANPEERAEAMIAAEMYPDITGRFRHELGSAYLGERNIARVVALGEDNPTEDDDDPMSNARRQMTQLWMSLMPTTDAYMGFSIHAWTHCWARPSDGEEIGDLKPLSDKDDEPIESYEHFLAGRKVCALYMVENQGGEVRLTPRLTSDQEVVLPVTKNRLLLFRHDLMGYCYAPEGESIAIQAWSMTENRITEVPKSSIAPKLTGVRGPPLGANAQVMSLDCRVPGNSTSQGAFRGLVYSGCDGVVLHPSNRWDYNEYCTDGDDWVATFKSYTKHGGFLSGMQLIEFDNDFFGIDSVEASVMSPNQRNCLEVGYGCLAKAGHTKQTLFGESIGFFLGDVGMDWHAAAGWWSLASPDKTSPQMTNNGIHVGVCATRLSHMYNLVGPVHTVDTACSSSLVSLQAGHKQLMHFDTDKNKGGSCTAPHSILAGGVNVLITPMTFISNCQASMLSHIGRCWTFDRTADGYQRGEGTGFMFVKWSGDEVDIEERLVCLVGSCSNHDGRSASLTAPNGPSQQLCIRLSMRMAEVDPSKISIAECHGTGTALGDPIEVGALQGVMRGMRTYPLYNTSAKSNIGHLEGGAGIAGIMKCVILVLASACAPNCHLKVLNPNLEATQTEGYPVFFASEICDANYTTTCVGVSSFGFGGTNSRADIYGRCLMGPRNTGNIWSEERIALRNDAFLRGRRSCFKGMEHVLPLEALPMRRITMIGTWDGGRSMSELVCTSPGCYTGKVTLGDMRWEEFALQVDGDSNRQLFPAIDQASSSALLVGPGSNPQSRRWRIKGRDQGVPSGTSYKITLEWVGDRKTISWDVDRSAVVGKIPAHRYDVSLSSSYGELQEMSRCDDAEGSYETTVTIKNALGFESFNFARDSDWEQIIYPAYENVSMRDTGVPVLGPDAAGRNNKWTVQGDYMDEFHLRLSVINGEIRVMVNHLSDGTRAAWESPVEIAYYIKGSFNGWTIAAMTPEARATGLFRYHITIGSDEVEEFEIFTDKNGTGTMLMLSDESSASEAATVSERFQINGKRNTAWDIFLDLNQDDRQRQIYWRRSTAREQHLTQD